jgi:hypothetical protein
METPAIVPTDVSQLAIIQKKIILDNKILNGANWFFWIAGLSILNSVIYLFGSSFTFIIGLGATQITDGLMMAISRRLITGGGVVRYIGLVIDLVIAGVFIALGVLGRKRLRWALITGLVLYIIDGIILLLFQDFLGAAFHAWVVISILASIGAYKKLKALEANGNTESIESIRQRMPSLQPQVSAHTKKTRLILVGLIVGVLLLAVVLAYFNV